MAAISNSVYGLTSRFKSVPGLLVRIRQQLDTILNALNAAVPVDNDQLKFHASVRTRYLNYEEQFKEFNQTSDHDETELFLDVIAKFRAEILTQSKKLKFNMPMSSYLFSTTTALRAPTQPAPQQQYQAQPSALGQQIAAPVTQPGVGSMRGGGPTRPAYMEHRPRRSQSMPFNTIVEESDIRPTPLTMPPHRVHPVSARPNQYAGSMVSPSSGGTGHPSHRATSHSHQISVASTQTFGHGVAPLPVASRRSVESDQSLGSSTGDVSVAVHTGASYQAPGSVTPAPAHLVAWFQSKYPGLPETQILSMAQTHWEQRHLQQQQDVQHGQPRLR